MKSKKLLLSSLLGFACLGIYLTMTSSSSGQMGVAATGCGTNNCHGAQNAATGISFTGVPATGFVPGTNYPVTLTLTVANASLTEAGFDLKFSAGAISNPPANTMIMQANTELHHTAPKAMASNTVSWSFNWTAPAAGTPSVTLDISGNAVNNNNNPSGDQWNKTTITLNAAAPTAVADVQPLTATLYPNPAINQLNVQFGSNEQATGFRALTLSGALFNLPVQEIGACHYQLDLGALPTGNYVLLANSGKRMLHKVFSKQ